MTKRTRRTRPSIELKYKNCWHAPGYRDLRMVLVDPKTGEEYDFIIPSADLQRVIYDCADAAKQIGAPHPPIDWDAYPAQIFWPSITPWKAGDRTPAAEAPAMAVIEDTVTAALAGDDAPVDGAEDLRT
ncbi:hypothetical protein [Bradyrhizobium sp. BR 1433]|uniref:hypothetical protein n=1 Tax=Bradyrhizobium sp. BR 1433 TaxID=3447967 RepID=UPI003EE52D21